MKKNTLYIILSTFTVFFIETIQAQENKDFKIRNTYITEKINLIDEFLNGSDHSYIEEPDYNSYLYLYNYGFNKDFKYQLSHGRQSLKVGPGMMDEVGFTIGYGFLSIGYSKDVGSFFDRESNDNSQFQFSIYTNPFGINYYKRTMSDGFMIKSSSGFEMFDALNSGFDLGNIDVEGGTPVDLKGKKFDGLSTFENGIEFYYIFNNKRFSFPAAYDMSYKQLKSTGSFIAGAAYSNYKSDLIMTRSPFIDTEQFTKYIEDETDNWQYIACETIEKEFYYRTVNLELGYSYNWVFSKNWLANLTLKPNISYKWSKSIDWFIATTSFECEKYHDFTINAKASAAVAWNNGKWYAGAFGNIEKSSFNNPSIKVEGLYFDMQTYIGIYFNLFKRKHNK